MDQRIAALAARKRRPGHDTTVRVRHVKPQPRTKTKRTLPPSAADTGYPGWQPKPKPCRREACETLFLPDAPAQVYCSPECRDQAARDQRRVTDRAARARRKAKREGKPFTRICALEECDVEFEPEHGRSLYCSPEHTAEARRRSRQRSEGKAMMPGTEEVVRQIERLEHRLGGRLPELTKDYMIVLWKKVNRDPNCPPHVYDRLERMLGLPPGPGSTMAAADE